LRRLPRERRAPGSDPGEAHDGRGHRHAQADACRRGAPRGARDRRHGGRAGGVVAWEEGEIVEAPRGLARLGLYVEPTSAVAAAGLTRLLDAGVIRPQESTVLVLTGSGLKASATVGEVLKLGARTA